MKKAFVIFMLMVFILPFKLNAEELALTLDDAVALALRDNRDVLLGAKDVEKAKYKIRQAWAEVLPSLTLGADRDYTQELTPKPYKTTTLHAGLNQVLFKSGQIVNTIKYNEHQWEVKKALLDKVKLEIVLSVKKAFFTLMLASEYYQLNKKIFENTKEHLSFLQERYKNGQASETDLLNIRSALSSVEKDFEAAQNQIEANQTILKKLLYLEPSLNLKPEGEFEYVPEEVAYDKAFLAAMSRRPEIKQYEAQGLADKRALGVAIAGNLPTIYASWDSYSGDHFITFTGVTGGKWKNYNVWGFTFSWPVFDGFATKAKIDQAIVDIKETQLMKEKVIRDIGQELKDAYLGLKNAVVKIEAAESDVRLYSNNRSTAEQKYKEGIASLLDMSDANLKFDVSLFNKNEAVYDYIVAKSRFDKATGGM